MTVKDYRELRVYQFGLLRHGSAEAEEVQSGETSALPCRSNLKLALMMRDPGRWALKTPATSTVAPRSTLDAPRS